ncbi:MAG: hypothetical protein P8170_04270 [Gemmatimonadota bacterium]|jgi:hypothetical protein
MSFFSALAGLYAMWQGLFFPASFQPWVDTTRHVDCQIELEKIIDVEGDEVDRSIVTLLRDDRIFLRRDFAPHNLAVFERRGGILGEKARFVGTVGARGEGPGEYAIIAAVVPLPDGGLALFDSRNLRLTRLAPDHAVVATYSIPVSVRQHGALLLHDGTYLVSGQMIERPHFGSAAVQLDSAGRVLRYYGRDETEKEGPLRGHMVPRHVSYHERHGTVTMKRNVEYAIEVWNDDGTLNKVISRDVAWFEWPPPRTPGVHGIGPGSPPENVFAGIQFDEAGRLWIVSITTPSDWQEGLDRRGRVVDRSKWMDYVIEVFDIDAEATLCTKVVKDLYFPSGFAGPGVIKSYHEDLFGRPTVTFWRLSLVS